MAIMIPEAVEGAEGAAGAATGARASRAKKPRGRAKQGPATQALERRERANARPSRVVQGEVIGRSDAPTSPSTSRASGGSSKPASSRKRNYGAYGKAGLKSAGPGLRKLSGREYGGVMLAEYIAGILILAVGMIIRGPSNGYLTVMSGFIMRATALTGVFFILFLLGPTKAGKAAMYFGALVDLSILFTATQQNVFSDVAKVVQGQPLEIDSSTVASNTEMTEPTPGPTMDAAS